MSSGSSVSNEGYIRTKKQLRDLLERLDVGDEVSFHKADFWCKDLGYHYDLIIRREERDKYLMTFTDYHAVYSNQPVKYLNGVVEAAWRWIRGHDTRKYRVY